MQVQRVVEGVVGAAVPDEQVASARQEMVREHIGALEDTLAVVVQECRFDFAIVGEVVAADRA